MFMGCKAMTDMFAIVDSGGEILHFAYDDRYDEEQTWRNFYSGLFMKHGEDYSTWKARRIELGVRCIPVTVEPKTFNCRLCCHFLEYDEGSMVCHVRRKATCTNGSEFKPSQPIQLYKTGE